MAEAKRGRGRPRAAPEDKRTRGSAIVVPCSSRERARYDELARSLGVPLAEFVRALLDGRTLAEERRRALAAKRADAIDDVLKWADITDERRETLLGLRDELREL